MADIPLHPGTAPTPFCSYHYLFRQKIGGTIQFPHVVSVDGWLDAVIVLRPPRSCGSAAAVELIVSLFKSANVQT